MRKHGDEFTRSKSQDYKGKPRKIPKSQKADRAALKKAARRRDKKMSHEDLANELRGIMGEAVEFERFVEGFDELAEGGDVELTERAANAQIALRSFETTMDDIVTVSVNLKNIAKQALMSKRMNVGEMSKSLSNIAKLYAQAQKDIKNFMAGLHEGEEDVFGESADTYMSSMMDFQNVLNTVVYSTNNMLNITKRDIRSKSKNVDVSGARRMFDSAIRLYKKASSDIAGIVPGLREGSEVDEEKWIGDAVKSQGRLRKYFGVGEGELIPMDKLIGAYEKLSKKPDRTKDEDSMMSAMALAIRFKGGDVPGGTASNGL